MLHRLSITSTLYTLESTKPFRPFYTKSLSSTWTYSISFMFCLSVPNLTWPQWGLAVLLLKFTEKDNFSAQSAHCPHSFLHMGLIIYPHVPLKMPFPFPCKLMSITVLLSWILINVRHFLFSKNSNKFYFYWKVKCICYKTNEDVTEAHMVLNGMTVCLSSDPNC